MATVTYPSRSKPLSDFTVGDLRVMIERQLSLRQLVPLAIEILEENPLAEAYHPGDLLEAVLAVDKQYWRANKDQWEAVNEIADSFRFAEKRLSDLLENFKTRKL